MKILADILEGIIIGLTMTILVFVLLIAFLGLVLMIGNVIKLFI